MIFLMDKPKMIPVYTFFVQPHFTVTAYTMSELWGATSDIMG